MLFRRSDSGLSRTLERILRSAGWYPARRRSLEGIDASFESDGLSLVGEARGFLSEFADLVIPVPGGESIDLRPGFNEMVYLERLADYRVRTQRDVVVVGRAQGMFLLLASDGSAFLAFDDDLVKLADTWKLALEHLVRRKTGQRLEP